MVGTETKGQTWSLTGEFRSLAESQNRGQNVNYRGNRHNRSTTSRIEEGEVNRAVPSISGGQFASKKAIPVSECRERSFNLPPSRETMSLEIPEGTLARENLFSIETVPRERAEGLLGRTIITQRATKSMEIPESKSRMNKLLLERKYGSWHEISFYSRETGVGRRNLCF